MRTAEWAEWDTAERPYFKDCLALRQLKNRAKKPQMRRSWVDVWVLGLCVAALGCSDGPDVRRASLDSEQSLDCPVRITECDVRQASCRDQIFRSVGCLRGYESSVNPPPVEFIRLEDVLADEQAGDDPAAADAAELARLVREGVSLFGLVSESDIPADKAAQSSLDGLLAFYLPSTKTVYLLEDSQASQLSEEELGVSVQAYEMEVLAHEYVHVYQDREIDLNSLETSLSGDYDPSLALISAIEGEAVLFEYFFVAQLYGNDPELLDWPTLMAAQTDAADVATAASESPWLQARGIFPYTYGAHSAAVLWQELSTRGLETLRESTATVEYLERRRGADPRGTTEQQATTTVPSSGQLGLLSQDQLGAWIYQSFLSRVVGLEVEEAAVTALAWVQDMATVWQAQDGEIVAQWVVDLSALDDPLREQLEALEAPRSKTAWEVTLQPHGFTVTASSSADSQRIAELNPTADPTVPAPPDALAQRERVRLSRAQLQLGSVSQRELLQRAPLWRPQHRLSRAAVARLAKDHQDTLRGAQRLRLVRTLSGHTYTSSGL